MAVAPSPPTSGTSLVVAAGHGTRFSELPAFAVVHPADADPTPENSELCDLLSVETDTLNLVRAQQGTTARSIQVGDRIACTVTRDLLLGLMSKTNARLRLSAAGGLELKNPTTGLWHEFYPNGADGNVTLHWNQEGTL